MARVIDCDATGSIRLEELLDWVEAKVDLRDPGSLASAAPLVRSLANDSDLVVRRLNDVILRLVRQEALFSSQVLSLGGRRDFYVRANFWPSTADMTTGRVLADHFAYNVAHDHNYSFITVGFEGPGYYTDLFEQDPSKLVGRIGESVELRFVQRIHFKTGMTMLYEACRDVHTQMPPDELSVSINLVAVPREVQLTEQHFFDLRNATIMEFPGDADVSKRVSILRLAANLGGPNTATLLDDLARSHPCRRSRRAAYEALVQLEPSRRAEILERAAADPEPLVRDFATEVLEK